MLLGRYTHKMGWAAKHWALPQIKYKLFVARCQEENAINVKFVDYFLASLAGTVIS